MRTTVTVPDAVFCAPFAQCGVNCCCMWCDFCHEEKQASAACHNPACCGKVTEPEAAAQPASPKPAQDMER